MTAPQDDPSTFRSPWWLPGPHLQTVVPSELLQGRKVRYLSEQWQTPDGDFILVDRTVPTARDIAASRPTLVVFHGLEGDSQSHYVRKLMAEASERRWHGVAINFRSCGGELNWRPRFYHSGDSPEMDWILRRLASERSASMAATRPAARSADGDGAPLFVVGVSLGGNVLLKWLGEQGREAANLVAGAAVVSAPMDLTAVGMNLGRGLNLQIYAKHFLRLLKRKCRLKLKQFPGLFEADRMEASRDLYEYDDAVTAPLHGYRDVDDYWSRASSKPWLTRIAVPTLILNALNDPFQPRSVLPRPDEVSSLVTLAYPAQGGHCGFVDAGPDGIQWMARRIVRYLDTHAIARASPALEPDGPAEVAIIPS